MMLVNILISEEKYGEALDYAIFNLERLKDGIRKKSNESNGKILINPGTFKLPRPINSNTKFTYFGYLIADDKESAEEVFKNYI
jgi:hypothetical protein